MATLEIHDPRNGVRRVRITREVPAMFGTDPMCDIRLEGAGVQPFHGRIRWKTRRFKADASPEVPYIEVNGVAVKSKSLYQGDEIRVGACRIFLLSVEDGPDHGEKTVVTSPPIGSRPAAPASPPAPTPRRPTAADFGRMPMAPPSLEEPAPRRPDGPLPRLKYGRSEPEDHDIAESPAPKRVRKTGLVESMKAVGDRSADSLDPADEVGGGKRGPGLFVRMDRAPGDDRVFSSPMVIGLVGMILVLVLFSVLLWKGIALAEARKQYSVAVEDLESGDYRVAVRDFDRFLASFPKDDRANKARVLRGLARVRQHTGTVGASWGAAFAEAGRMIDQVGGLPEYRDVSVELAEEVVKAVEGLADRARETADERILSEADLAVALHARIAGQASGSLLSRSKAPEKLAKARFAVRRGKDRAAGLAAMESALKARDPGGAYAGRDRMIRSYPDLAADREVIALLVRANDLIRQAVAFDPSTRPAESTAAAAPLGPPTSLVLRLDPNRRPEGKGPIAYALADGLAFGIDASTGAPLWQRPVGLASPFPPIAFAGVEPSALLVDAQAGELVRVDGRTGSTIWRQSLEGQAVDPPLVLGNLLYQPMPDGRLLQIDGVTGALRGALRLGRPIARTPIADESAEHLYQLGDEDCLFVLTPDPFGCVAVDYLGHATGSVPCAPARVGRFLVLPENHGLEDGRWRVFVLNPGGTAVRQAQEIPIVGWTRSTPASSGSMVWSASDRGELLGFSVGEEDAKAPFAQLIRVAAGPTAEGPAFTRARTDRELWLGSGRSGRYDVDPEKARLAADWSLVEAGPALAPPQVYDRVAVLTQRDAEGPGPALWGVEPSTGKVLWKTVLGSPWPSTPIASSTGDALTTIASDGRVVTLTRDNLRAGGFVTMPLPSPGEFRLPRVTAQRLDFDGLTAIIPESGASRILIGDGSGPMKRVELPAPLGAAACRLGDSLLVPGIDGRVYLIDPRTGVSAADPLVPDYDRARPTRWLDPAPLGREAVLLADSGATLRRLAVEKTPRPRLVATAEVKLDSPLVRDPASTGAAVLVATADGRIRSLSSADLKPQGTWTLEGVRLFGPVAVGDHAFAADSAGNVLAFAPEGRRLWTSRLREAIPAGPPLLATGSAWFLGRDGSAERLSLDDGNPRARVELGILPVGGPSMAGPDLVLPTGFGTLRTFDPSTGANPR